MGKTFRAMSVFVCFASVLSACGRSTVNSKLAVSLGDVILPRPWLVSLLAGDDEATIFDFAKSKTSKSTGSLLCPNVLLTAEHSVDSKVVKIIGPKILVGDYSNKNQPAVIADMVEKRVIHYADGSLNDGIAIVRMRPTHMGKQLQLKLKEMTYPKIGDFSHWKNPQKIFSMAILGYGTSFAEFDQPLAGALLVHEFQSVKLTGFDDDRDLGALANGRIDFRMNVKTNISAISESESIVHGKWQVSEHGDSGGPLLMNAVSDYIFGIVVGGLDPKDFYDGLKSDIGKFDEHGELTNQEELDLRFLSYHYDYPSTYTYNIAASPVRERIMATMRDWCEKPSPALVDDQPRSLLESK